VIVQLADGTGLFGFSLLAGLGAALGLSWSVWQADGERRWIVVEAGLWTLLGALLASRAAYVLVNWAYFQTHLWQALQPQLGGLAWPGALAGGLLALAIFCAVNRMELGALADDLTPMLGVLVACLWLGCWLDGCAYGAPVVSTWLPGSVDEWGNLVQRWPVQLAGAALTLIWFWLINRLAGWARPGVIASAGLLGLAVIQLYLSLQRVDAGLEWGGLRLDAWIALAYAGLALAALLFFEFRKVPGKQRQRKYETKPGARTN
jgi:phosphatidylglycerol---prolipoprotein diacylglyceryl transferase